MNVYNHKLIHLTQRNWDNIVEEKKITCLVRAGGVKDKERIFSEIFCVHYLSECGL